MLRASQYALLFLAGVIVARSLGPEMRAEYALSFALGSAVWVLVNLSLPEAAGRLLARHEASLVQVSRILYAASLLLGIVGAGLAIGVGFAVRGSLLQNASSASILLAALIVPLTLVQQMSVGLLVRLGALAAYGWGCALTSLLQLALVVLLAVTFSLTPEYALAAAVIALAARALVLSVALGRYAGMKALVPGGTGPLAWRVLNIGFVLHPAYLAIALILRVDLFLVSALCDARAVGLYSLATMLAETLFLASTTIAQSAMKTLTDADEGAAARYTVWFSRQAFAIAVAGAGLMSILAYPLVVVVYGREWIGSVLPLIILAGGSVALSLDGPIRIMMIRLANPSVIALIAGVGFAVNVVLNLVLIPLWGITGAALASLVSYWLYIALMLVRFRRATGLQIRPIFQRPSSGDVIPRLIRATRRRVPRHRVA